MAVERLNRCDDVGRLAKELGVYRRLLYTWRDKLEGMEAAQSEENPVGNSREAALRKEVRELKRVLAEKALEVDFFKGALQKIEARRQKSEKPGERASTTKSGE
jgi:predicted RNase H-like nuclease (RuvC/YqgF family)